MSTPLNVAATAPESLKAQIDWMIRVRDRLEKEASAEIREAARPLREGLALISTSTKKGDVDPKTLEQELEIKINLSQGLAVYAMLVNLKKARDAWSKEAQALDAGSTLRAHLELAVASMNHALESIGGAYNAVREGNRAALRALPEQLDRLMVMEDEIRRSVDTIRPRKLGSSK
jgi:hypothetical protein